MRIDQRMRLAPRMIQSMEILQLPSAALEQRIEQELSTNPTLELRDPGADSQAIEAERAQEKRDEREGERELVVKDDQVDSSHADDFERLNNISEEYADTWASNTGGARPARNSGERDAKMDAMANAAARPQSLADQLLSQWSLVECSATIRKAGEFLIGFIDDDGYLRTDRQTLLDQVPAEMEDEELDQAIGLLQASLEPVGIGARDLRECLLLQIDTRLKQHEAGWDSGPPPNLSLERALVATYLKDIEANRLPKIAKATGLPIDRIKKGIHNLRQFHPHPGRLLLEDSPRNIAPDAMIEYEDTLDRYTASLTNDRLPTLHINNRYTKMARDPAVDRKTKDFVSNNIRSARWLIDAIQQRQSTLLRVINVVIEAQRDFLDTGPQNLKPLPMTTVADQLGIHVATVSRAVSEKYVQTPRGIFPLRMFFSGGTETETGDAMSWTAIQAKLKEIIQDEDKSDPLSDDQLVEHLKRHGIEIARRTVAKYRKQLHIPAARQRKQF